MSIGQWFSFRGRIARKTFWLGYVLPLFLASVVANILDVALGLAPSPMADAMAADAAQVAPLGGLVSLLSIWPSLAGTIKRLHDRDRSGWWIGGFYLAGSVAGVVAFMGIANAPANVSGAVLMVVGAGALILGYGVWLLVETGFLRGTTGPNRFGADPLGGAYGAPQWQQGMPPQPGWQPQGPPQQWQQPGQWQQPQQPQQPQWQPPPQQGWQPPPQQGWQQPPQGYPPPQNPGAAPPGYGQPPPGYGQPPQQPPGQWGGPGQGGSVPPVRRD